MKNIKKFLATIIGIAVLTSLTGCYTTVTHHYSHFQPMSREEAIRLVSELNISFGIASKREYSITADQNEFTWVIPQFHTVSSYRTGNIIHYRGYYTYPVYHAVFNNITAIQMDRRPTLVPGGPSTYEILLKHNGGCYWHVDFSKYPEKYNEYLSAFLVLCPNVK